MWKVSEHLTSSFPCLHSKLISSQLTFPCLFRSDYSLYSLDVMAGFFDSEDVAGMPKIWVCRGRGSRIEEHDLEHQADLDILVGLA